MSPKGPLPGKDGGEEGGGALTSDRSDDTFHISSDEDEDDELGKKGSEMMEYEGWALK